MTATGIGVFARAFPAANPRELARAIRDSGFDTTQLNLSALGRPTLDVDLDDVASGEIRRAFAESGVSVWGLSGTFNAVHPDVVQRARDTEACRALTLLAPLLGVEVVTLCTGTRDPVNMWRAHPANGDASTWSDLRETLDRLLPAAAEAAVRLGIEPERGTVVSDAHTARRLLTELGDDSRLVTVVLDPANLLSLRTLPGQREILTEAFDLLGPWVGALHAKDVVAGGYSAAGTGGMDFDLVMHLHQGLPRGVPIIAQDLTAEDGPRVSAFLRQALEAAAY